MYLTPTIIYRVNVSRLVDKRFQGVAKGVGTQKILGRVHLLPLKIGKTQNIFIYQLLSSITMHGFSNYQMSFTYHIPQLIVLHVANP